jgi:undecaprenyl-diphosphatase
MPNEITIFQGLILGVVQGLSEFLPISSSGHLILFRDLLNIPSVPLIFDVWLHIATLLVICLYYRVLIVRLVGTFFRLILGKRTAGDVGDLKLIIAVIVATVFTVGVALLLRALGMESFSSRTVSLLMLVTAALLVSSIFPTGKTSYEGFTWKTMVVTGIAQGFGTLAGISRSGITITASLWCGMDRRTAGEYSFILSIPAVLGALVLTVFEANGSGVQVAVLPILAGCLTAFISGLLSLRLLLWMVKQARLWYFSIYLVVVAVIGLTVLF